MRGRDGEGRRGEGRDRAVFKGGRGYGFISPHEMLKRKFFGNVNKHAQRNAVADALYVCTIVMPGKAIWRQ